MVIRLEDERKGGNDAPASREAAQAPSSLPPAFAGTGV